MRTHYQIMAYDSNGDGECVGMFTTFDEAEDYYFMLVEGTESDDDIEYIIETVQEIKL